MADCSSLGAFRDLEEYASDFKNVTSFNETILLQCRVEICSALWGAGIPDLSGIGVAVGYMCSTFLGPLLSILALAPIFNSSRLSRVNETAASALAVFFDSAVYFAFAIQAATITTLVPKDWELAETTFGDYEARIAGLVSVICLLPLLYPIAVLPAIETTNGEIKSRMKFRRALFTVTVIVGFYPFVSSSVRNFAQTQMGDGQGEGGNTNFDDEQSATLVHLCFEENYFTLREERIMRAFQLLASLFVFVFTVAMLVPGGARRLKKNYGISAVADVVGKKIEAATKVVGEKMRWLRYVLVFVPVLLSVPLLWGFWRIRTLQEGLSKRITQSYEGNEWGFGQVMAITIFLPVFAEVVLVLRGEGQAGGQRDMVAEEKPEEYKGE